MTDEQILNALKSCGDRIAICDGCPYEGRNHCSLLAKQDIIERFNTLKAKNAELRERLSKAVELPRVECIMTREWLSREIIGAIMFEWCVLYKNGGYLMAEPCLSKEAAEIRLAELKGENE